MSVVGDIEDALVAQWSHFGRWPRGELHDEDGLVWFRTPITHLPYNGVVRTHLAGGDAADTAIADVLARVRADGAQCFWIVHPTATPGDLDERLRAHGLSPVERMTCMSLELADWQAPALSGGVAFEEVTTDEQVRTYSDLTASYWEIGGEEQELVAELHRHWAPGKAPGHRYLALVEGEPVGKAYLSLAGPPGVASVYGMFVRPEGRGRGVAGGLTTTLLARARERGSRRVVLHATEMAVGVYRRAGFVERCELTVFATTPLWSDAH